MTEFTNESRRAHLSLNPSRVDTRDAETQRDERVNAYLEDQKRQQAASSKSKKYDLDEAYNLGVGMQSRTYEVGEKRSFSQRMPDLKHKAKYDEMRANGFISEAAYQEGLREAGFLPELDEENDHPANDVAPIQYDAETSNNAQWMIDTVGKGAFNTALTAYAMGDSTAAMNLAKQVHEHGVTVSDITGLYDKMAQTALTKIKEVMAANGDTDVTAMEVVDWARKLQPGQQVYHLSRTAMASAIYGTFDHVPELVETYRRAKARGFKW